MQNENIKCKYSSNKFENLVDILKNNILDYKKISIYESDFVKKMNFQLADLGVNYTDGDTIKVDNIWYSYDYIGMENNPINIEEDKKLLNLEGVNGVVIDQKIEMHNIYIDYAGNTDLYCSDDDCQNKICIVEKDLIFEIVNLVITINGTIGTEPFIGYYRYSGDLV